jgi:hypothetical protein
MLQDIEKKRKTGANKPAADKPGQLVKKVECIY